MNRFSWIKLRSVKRSTIKRGTRLAASLLVLLAFESGLTGCQFDAISEVNDQEPAAQEPGTQGLVIQNDSEMPEAYPHRSYEFHFQARGSTQVLHWKVEKGALPPGMVLEDSGLLHGSPDRAGEFQFTASVIDGGNQQTAVEKGFLLRVIAALTVNWRIPAHVNGNRIEGSVSVTNTSPDDMDLTFVAMAVAGNGRATAIGYQRFVLKNGTVGMELPLGETLPHGGYVIHVDVVGEVAARNLIYRDRLQTPGPLQVTVGP
jgi:putative Ig domain-containing protein